MRLRRALPILALPVSLVWAGVAVGQSSASEVALGSNGFAWIGPVCVGVFALAYVAVMTEELHNLRKSKPAILAAGIIWMLIGARDAGSVETSGPMHEALLHELSGFSSLFLFLLVSMTFVNAMNDRNVFATIRVWLLRRQMTYRQLFHATGAFAFVLSAFVDNLISALLMGAVITTVANSKRRFACLACVNVVVAANAGGAFSPFGDITTLLVWQSGQLGIFQFLPLLAPSIVTYLVPAVIMGFFAPTESPSASEEDVQLKPGAKRVCILFVFSIVLAVFCEHLLGLPPFLGMMTGMSVLMMTTHLTGLETRLESGDTIDVYREVGRAEWDTLLFFFGIIFAIGGLGHLGYLDTVSAHLYGAMGTSAANIVVGAMSAVVDNIPVMFAILQMDPSMSVFEWQLITFCVGVGGSLLSVGSAAGVGMMGIARGHYSFAGHLKWSPVILLGYGAGIATHFALHALFSDWLGPPIAP
jgi:Na+/H+ antiporter NhaD/arsenite permease-like protein